MTDEKKKKVDSKGLQVMKEPKYFLLYNCNKEKQMTTADCLTLRPGLPEIKANRNLSPHVCVIKSICTKLFTKVHSNRKKTQNIARFQITAT